MTDECEHPGVLELLQAMRRVQTDHDLDLIEVRMNTRGEGMVRLRITGIHWPVAEIYDDHGNRFNLHPQPAL